MLPHTGDKHDLQCSRHWFFGANLIVDGQTVPETLMSLVKDTLKAHPNNSVIGFKDNSSAIRYGMSSMSTNRHSAG